MIGQFQIIGTFHLCPTQFMINNDLPNQMGKLDPTDWVAKITLVTGRTLQFIVQLLHLGQGWGSSEKVDECEETSQ